LIEFRRRNAKSVRRPNMSRDARVGLVIICSFVVLLGTILLHRFYLTGGDKTEALLEPVVSEDDSDRASDGQTGFPLKDFEPPTAAVDAVSAETFPPDQSEVATGRDTIGAAGQKIRRTPHLARPPADLAPADSNGAMISLTEAETESQAEVRGSAAIVETIPANQRHASLGSSGGGNNVGMETAPKHAPPMLEIRNSPQDTPPARSTSRDDSLKSFSREGVSQPRSLPPQESTGVITDSEQDVGADSNRIGEVVQDSEGDSGTNMFDEETASSSDSSGDAGLTDEPPNRGASGRFSDDTATVQQAEGKRQPSHDGEGAPPLPKYGGSRQATIEPVPQQPGEPFSEIDSPTTSQPKRATPPRTVGTENRFDADASNDTGQKTYVVRDGDSFWTISAKHYGTGKYFRVLEEYNRHRLAVHEGDIRILRPGTEILLPSLATLRSKTAAPKSNSGNTSGQLADGFRPLKGDDRFAPETRPSERRSNASPSSYGSRRVYTVREGDSLSKIAQRELGAAKRWQEIYQLNAANLDGQDVLKIGMELILPDDSPTVNLVDRAREGR
jgi:nucleoid-associated protein YgaU